MGQIADYYGPDQNDRELQKYLDEMEVAEAQARVDEHNRLHHQQMIDALTTPRVSQNFVLMLGQDDVWYNKDGVGIPLKAIDARYARNICNFLLERALPIHNAMVAFFLSTPGPTPGSIASDDFDDAFAEVLQLSPGDLVKQSELYQALEKIAGGPKEKVDFNTVDLSKVPDIGFEYDDV